MKGKRYTEAPQAEQVADRWHLLLNIRQMLERYLPGVYERLKRLPDAAAADSNATSKRTRAYRRTGAEAVASRESRKRRLARYEEVKRLYDGGKNLSVISRELALDVKTVRGYAYAEAFPERVRQPGPSILDPYLSYLDRRHRAGCENASQLWREIVEQGFPGSKRQVLKWMRETRRTPAPTTPGRYLEGVRAEKRTATHKPAGGIPKLPSAKQLAWLFIQEPAKAPGRNARILARVLQDAEVAHVYASARTFVDLVRHKRPEALDAWLEGTERHVLTGEGEENRYARAIYPVSDLEPYRERLEELEKVQAAGLELLGGGESPKGLLPPKVVEGVRHVRLSRHPNYVPTVLSHAGTVERLGTLLAATKANLKEFEVYASTVDPKREQLEAEVEAIRGALEVVRATPDERFRFRAHAVRVRPYLYPLHGDPYQLDTRKHGLVLVGPHVTVVQDDPTRKRRSDKKFRTPLLELPALQVYAESEWRGAEG